MKVWKSPLHREKMIQEVVRLDRFKYTQEEIGALLELSQQLVSKFLNIAKKRYRNQAAEDLKVTTQDKLQELRVIRWEALQAWIKSKKPNVHTKKVYERVVQSKPKSKKVSVFDTDDAEEVGKLIVVEMTRQVSSGSPRNEFLHTILETIRMEMDLLGLEAPKNLNLNQQIQTIDWTKFLLPSVSDTEARVLPEDPFKGYIDSVKTLPESNSNGVHKGE